MRFIEYAVVSTLVTAGVVFYAYATRVQFYPAVIYLVTSKPAIMVLGNMAFVFTIALGQLTNKIFLGRLREVEREIIWENLRYAFTETCLALSTFREEMSLNVVIMFTSLLFAKVFHWLCEARVEHLEQAQEMSRLAHVRTVSLMAVLLFADVCCAGASLYVVQTQGASVQVFFGFEYVLLGIKVVEVFIKYCLAAIDMHFIQGQWYNKSLYELYLKLVIDVAQLFVNVIFFAIIFTYYGVPLHLMRQLYIAVKNVHDRLTHFWRFRRITANLHDRFPNATEEDLEATDRVCIICREEMVAGTGVGAPKKLRPCGHIFHFYCLRNWLERQLKCPTCRTDISTRPAQADAQGQAAQPPQQQLQQPQQPQQPQGGAGAHELPGQHVPHQHDHMQERRERETNQRFARLAHQLGLNADQAPLQAAPNDEEPSRSPPRAAAAAERARATEASTAATLPSSQTNSSPSQDQDESREPRQDSSSATSSRPRPQYSQTGAASTSNRPPNQGTGHGVPPSGAGMGSAPSFQGSSGYSSFPSRLRTPPNLGFPMGLPQTHSVTGDSMNGIEMPTVAQYLQSQIEILQLQLQVYQAQANAAHATRRAAVAAMRARNFHERQQRQDTPSPESDQGMAPENMEGSTNASDGEPKEPVQPDLETPVPAPGSSNLMPVPAPESPTHHEEVKSNMLTSHVEEDNKMVPAENVIQADESAQVEESTTTDESALHTPQQELRQRLAAAALARSQREELENTTPQS